MGLNALDLNLLPVLEALLEEESLTRAGTRLGTDTAQVSRGLTRLRRHYQDGLLTRAGSGYSLTPLARTLLPMARESIRQIERVLPAAGQAPPEGAADFVIAVSDYSAVLLEGELLRRIRELAPEMRLEIRRAVPHAPCDRQRQVLRQDLLIAPLGPGQPGGRPEVISRDRLACVTDPANPRLDNGRLSLAGLSTMPHAAVAAPHPGAHLIRDALDKAGITPSVTVTTADWLQLPFLVAGTDMVAVIPERLARRLAGTAGVTVTEPPLGTIEIAEAAWWHPRHADPAYSWLRRTVREVVAAQLFLATGG
jgi:DNA-binding transcriptional LysR family regulator